MKKKNIEPGDRIVCNIKEIDEIAHALRKDGHKFNIVPKQAEGKAYIYIS